MITTIDLVKYEILKGSANISKYKEKEKLIGDITDITIPILPKTFALAFELIKIYGIDGVVLSNTDLMLGVTLTQYNNLYLMTRDTTEFLQNIFSLLFIVNCKHRKGVFTYGIYQDGR